MCQAQRPPTSGGVDGVWCRNVSKAVLHELIERQPSAGTNSPPEQDHHGSSIAP